MNLRDLGGVFRVWMDSVAETLSSGLASVRRSHKLRLTEEVADTFKVDLTPDEKGANTSAERIRIVDGAIVGPLPQHLGEALQGSHIDIILKPHRFMFRPLDLPKRAGEFLEGIIRSQIDRLTPWSATEAVFGWTLPLDAAKDRIELTVVATARARVAPYVQSLVDAGAASISVSTFQNFDGDSAIPVAILQQRGANALDVDSMRRGLTAVLVAAALSLVFAMAAAQIAGAALDAQKSDVLHRVAERRAAILRNGSTGASPTEAALEQRKRATPSSVIVLEALSNILPDHTYATELRVEGDKLQVVGITHDAPSLIRLIEQSPHFTRATFFAPTTRSLSDPGERFHIEARIMPGFEAHR
jgi:general secretion pathway protein L